MISYEVILRAKENDSTAINEILEYYCSNINHASMSGFTCIDKDCKQLIMLEVLKTIKKFELFVERL